MPGSGDTDHHVRPSGWTWTALGTGAAGLVLSPAGILVPVCVAGMVIAAVGIRLDRDRGHESGAAWVAGALNAVAILAAMVFATR